VLGALQEGLSATSTLVQEPRGCQATTALSSPWLALPGTSIPWPRRGTGGGTTRRTPSAPLATVHTAPRLSPTGLGRRPVLGRNPAWPQQFRRADERGPGRRLLPPGYGSQRSSVWDLGVSDPGVPPVTPAPVPFRGRSRPACRRRCRCRRIPSQFGPGSAASFGAYFDANRWEKHVALRPKARRQ
jgi:hypothetical protein